MTCPECGREQLPLDVPSDLREYLPERSDVVAVCTHCLTLEVADATSAADVTATANATATADATPDFSAISDSFPTGDAGVAMALAVGLLDSLALYRNEIEALLEQVERNGSDPLLVLDRLDADAGVEPAFDVDRRRTQVEQLMYG